MQRQFQFEWDAAKAAVNMRKHRVPFELAASIFADPNILTVPDIAHSDIEERWISIVYASNGALLSVAYTWSDEAPNLTKLRLKSTKKEIPYYQGDE